MIHGRSGPTSALTSRRCLQAGRPLNSSKAHGNTEMEDEETSSPFQCIRIHRKGFYTTSYRPGARLRAGAHQRTPLEPMQAQSAASASGVKPYPNVSDKLNRSQAVPNNSKLSQTVAIRFKPPQAGPHWFIACQAVSRHGSLFKSLHNASKSSIRFKRLLLEWGGGAPAKR